MGLIVFDYQQIQFLYLILIISIIQNRYFYINGLVIGNNFETDSSGSGEDAGI